MNEPRIVVIPTPEKWAQKAADLIIEQAQAAIEARGTWSFVLSGGGTPKPVYQALAERKGEIDWQNTFIFFGDERCVPPDHPESNYRMAKEAFLDAVPIEQQNIFRMIAEIGPKEAAEDYQGMIEAHFFKAEKRFDTLLLGLGNDGHTASLFPGEPALKEDTAWVVPSHNPHNQTERLTLTFPAINSARNILFLVTGESKAPVIADVIQNPSGFPNYPAKQVIVTESAPTWLLDQAAASELNS